MKKINSLSDFSKNLIRIRKKRGLSQSELAKLSKLTVRKISYYENEAKKPPIDNIESLAIALDVSLNDLLETQGKSNKNTGADLSQLDSRTASKIKLILSLSKEERHIIYSIAENFHAKRELQEIKQNNKHSSIKSK